MNTQDQITVELAILKQELTKREDYLLGYFRESADKIVDDPARYLEWCHKDFELAGELRVVQSMLNAILNVPDITKERLIKVCVEHAIGGAKYPGTSTSMPANLIKQYITAAYAHMIETLTYS